jgi:putative ABC transport system permease protein
VSRTRYETLAQSTALHERLEREILALPGVRAVGAASALPLTAGVDQAGVHLPGAPGNTGDNEHDQPLADYIPARGRYFDALGIRLIAGRLFAPAVTPGLPEVLIDRTLAEQFYPNGSPVGMRILVDGDSGTVIGVIEHARQYDIHQNGRPQVYIRNETNGYRSLSYAIKTERAPADLIPEVRAAVRRVDAQLAIADLKPMTQVVDESLRQQRLSAVLIAGFSLGALALAAMGLFGVVASSVNRRRHEIAVRLALGADHRQVRRLVLREGVGLILGGVLLGAPGIYLAGRAVAGALVGVSPFDALTLGSVAAGLVVVAIVACYIPARRVTGIEPAQAFREE